MKKISSPLVLAAAILILIAATTSDLTAKEKFSYDGQIRLRSEYNLKSFNPDRHSQIFHDLRTRVGLKFEPHSKVTVYVQLQDSRRLGDPSSGDLTATDNVDLHQAFFEIRDAVFKKLWIKAGRFEMNYGNQRIFGAVGWHNIGRSWEGGLASFRSKDIRVDLFSLKRMELNDEDYNRDFDVNGVYVMFHRAHLDLFWFYELDADTNGYVTDKLKRYNIGGYYERDHKDFDLVFQGNYQYGEFPRGPFPDRQILDISAYMFAGEIGYSFYGDLPGRIALGIDYSSGSEDSLRENTYTNAYYTGHKFRGYMDYFIGDPDYGLVDRMIRLRLEPARRWSASADLHFFRAADYRVVSATEKSKEIGSEFDLTVENKSIKGATVTGGISVFFPEDQYSGFGKEHKNGIWAYLMTTVNF